MNTRSDPVRTPYLGHELRVRDDPVRIARQKLQYTVLQRREPQFTAVALSHYAA